MVTARSGHSLVELLAALVFLGASLAGVASASWLGSRWAAAAVTRQRAVGLAAATLDSLTMSPEFEAGSATSGPLLVTWGAAGNGEIVVAVGTAAADTPLVTLSGKRLVPVPRLPDRQ